VSCGWIDLYESRPPQRAQSTTAIDDARNNRLDKVLARTSGEFREYAEKGECIWVAPHEVAVDRELNRYGDAGDPVVALV